jgi:hypothetical protein
MAEKYSTKQTRLGRNVFKVERIKKPDDENLLKPGEEEGEGYKGTPDMYPDYEEDRKELIGDIEGSSMPTMSHQKQDSVIGGAVGSMPYIKSEDPIKLLPADDKAYMQSRGYNKGGSVSRGVGKAIRGTKFKGVF